MRMHDSAASNNVREHRRVFPQPSSRGASRRASCEDKRKVVYFVTKTYVYSFDKFSRENLSKEAKICLHNPQDSPGTPYVFFVSLDEQRKWIFAERSW